MDPLLAAFVAELKSFTGCEAVGIRILDEEGNIPYEACEGFSREFYDLESPLSVKSDRCMCVSIIRGQVDLKSPFCTNGGSFHANSTTGLLAAVPEEEKGQTRNTCNEYGYESVALVPIRLADSIIGLIHIADTREDMVPREKVEMLEGIAMQFGVAIRRARAEAALHWQAEVGEILANLSTVLLASQPIEDVSGLVLEYAKRLTGSALGYVGYIDPDTGYLVSPTLTEDIWEECRVPDKNIVFKKFSGLWGWVLQNRKPLLTNAPTEDPRSSGTPSGHLPIRRFLSAPALFGNTLVGQVALANSDRDYSENDLDLVERLAALYAIAVQRNRAEQALENVARFPSENPWPVLRVAEDGTILYANAASESLLREWRSQIGQSAPGYIVDFAAKVLDSGLGERLELEHMGRTFSFAVVPVAEAGYVNLYGRDITDRVRAEEELERHRHHLQELVDERTAELEISHQQLRGLAAHLRDAREEERAWVAREIHDELGQLLTGLELDLSWLNTKLPEVAGGESRQLLLNKISSMSSLVDKTIESVQRIATELRPSVLDDFGLLAAIESQTRQFQERTGIKCKVALAVGDTALGPAASTALFRIIQEALTNVARHAEASKVVVSLKSRDDKVTLVIRDDGKGIAAGEVLRSTSLGFLGMRERTLALGGEFDVASAPLKGTTIKVTVPLGQ
jgi:signal transduction histidine kinase